MYPVIKVVLFSALFQLLVGIAVHIPLFLNIVMVQLYWQSLKIVGATIIEVCVLITTLPQTRTTLK